MAWTDFILPAAATVGSAFLGSEATKDANEKTLASQKDFNRDLLARADRPRTDVYGNTISSTGVDLSPQGQQIVDAMVGSSTAANDAFKAFNTSGFYGGEADPNNRFNVNNATRAIQDDNQKTREAYIDPALEEFALRSARMHGSSSNLGSGLQDEVSRLQSQYEIGDNQDILDYIIKNTLGVGNQQAGVYTSGQGSVPQTGVDSALVGVLNSQARPGAVAPDLTGASLALGAGNIFNAYNEQQSREQEAGERNRIIGLLERQLGNQTTQPTSRSQGSNFLDLSYFQ